MNDVAPDRPFLDPMERGAFDRLARLFASNPFEPAWDELLREIIGPDLLHDLPTESPFVGGPVGAAKDRLTEPLARVLGEAAERLRAGVAVTAGALRAYQGAALYSLWDRFGDRLQKIIDEDGTEVPFYDDFVRAYQDLFGHPSFGDPALRVPEPRHLLALYYQARRAAWFITRKIAGRSPAACRSRAAIWRAILGSDLCTYARDFYRSMDEFPVLITGETGTGKELAAECIGWSRYLPFDPGTRRFAAKYADDFHARSLCEASSELLESTLFGHKKGSFTGAVADAQGYFGMPREHGTLFLDEAGEIPLHVQPKLLRPFQKREYVPVGEARPRKMHGRLVFATHRDLQAMSAGGTFREDLYERMNGFRVHMPPLRELCAEGGLLDYVARFVAERIDGLDQQCEKTLRAMRFLQDTKGDYDWPRNVRELKNEVDRFLLDEGAREPVASSEPPPGPAASPVAPESVCLSSGILGPRAKVGDIDREELLRAYVTQIYVSTGLNIAETARRTGFNRRTVPRWIDPVRVARLQARRNDAEHEGAAPEDGTATPNPSGLEPRP
jgi:hypothetical protein